MLTVALVILVLAALSNESRTRSLQREIKVLRARVDDLELGVEKPNLFLGGDDE